MNTSAMDIRYIYIGLLCVYPIDTSNVYTRIERGHLIYLKGNLSNTKSATQMIVFRVSRSAELLPPFCLYDVIMVFLFAALFMYY